MFCLQVTQTAILEVTRPRNLARNLAGAICVSLLAPAW